MPRLSSRLQLRAASLHFAAIVSPIASADAGRPLTNDVDHPGIGDRWYARVRKPTAADKAAFFDVISAPSVAAERRWVVPAAVLSGMAIVEPGCGTTRLAIKSGDILSCKWPGDTIAAARKRFVLWCQPAYDRGNVYPVFADPADAIDFVASRLARSSHYKVTTDAYRSIVARGTDPRTAGRAWLTSVAVSYNGNPAKYVADVTRAIEDPIGDGSRTLWSPGPKQ